MTVFLWIYIPRRALHSIDLDSDSGKVYKINMDSTSRNKFGWCWGLLDGVFKKPNTIQVTLELEKIERIQVLVFVNNIKRTREVIVILIKYKANEE